jgi:hypothetical protein
MAAIVVIIALVAVCVLAGFFGADSRQVDAREHRPNWS